LTNAASADKVVNEEPLFLTIFMFFLIASQKLSAGICVGEDCHE
jgi:hypothetical protein